MYEKNIGNEAKRYGTILRGIVESFEQKDNVQTEFWLQVSRKILTLPLAPDNFLVTEKFDIERDTTDSQWVLDFSDPKVYAYYVYFIRLSNKQASLSVDKRGWVRTPIFLRKASNQGVWLDVSNVPKEVPSPAEEVMTQEIITRVHFIGIVFKTK